MKKKQTLALLLAGAMLVPNAFAASPEDFHDFPTDWSAAGLRSAVRNGLLNGSNGEIDGNGMLTRAQLAAIVNRAFGADKAADLSGFTDVRPDAWYHNDMAVSVAMGAFQGANGKLNPEAPITREEAFAVLARAFGLDGDASALSDYTDGGSVSPWAKSAVSALIDSGFVNGANGRLNPRSSITRAEFAKVISGMASTFADNGLSDTVDGNVIVRSSGVSLAGRTINGDLILADGAAQADLTNVTVTGRILIRGGADGVTFGNTSAGRGIIVRSDVSIAGTADSITVAGAAAVTVQSGASVDSITVNAENAKITGTGKVGEVRANADNVSVSTSGTRVSASEDVSGVQAGSKTVAAGKTETVSQTSGGSSSGGASSGGASSGGGSSSGGSSNGASSNGGGSSSNNDQNVNAEIADAQVVTTDAGAYLALSFKDGFKADATTVTVDGADVTAAVSRVTDDGAVSKLPLTARPGSVTLTSGGRTQTISLGTAQANAVYTGEDYLPDYFIKHGPLAMWDYYLTNYDDAGSVRVLPAKTTFGTSAVRSEHPSYSKPLVLDEDGKGNVVIMFNYNTAEEKAWFDRIASYDASLSEGAVQLVAYDQYKNTWNRNLKFETGMMEHNGRTVATLTIPFNQDNFRSNGRYYVRVTSTNSSGVKSTALASIHVQNYATPELKVKETPQSGVNLHFAVSNLVYGIVDPIEKVTLTDPTGETKTLEKIKDYYLISQDLFVLYNDVSATDGRNNLPYKGDYTLTIEANGFRKFSKSFTVAEGKEPAKQTAVTYDAISRATGSTSSGGSSSDGSGGYAISTDFLFDSDLVANANVLDKLNKSTADSTAVLEYWKYSASTLDSAFNKGDTKYFSGTDYMDYVSTDRNGKLWKSYADFRSSHEASVFPPHATKAVLEDGLLGDIQDSAVSGKLDYIKPTVSGNQQGSDVGLTFANGEDYLGKVSALYLNGDWRELDEKYYSIEGNTITLSKDLLHVGENALKIVSAGYKTQTVTFTYSKVNEENLSLSAEVNKDAKTVTLTVNGSNGDFLKNLTSVKLGDDAVYGEGVEGSDAVYYEIAENNKSLTLHNVKPGTYTVKIAAEYYEDLTAEFTMEKVDTPDTKTAPEISSYEQKSISDFYGTQYLVYRFGFNGLNATDLKEYLNAVTSVKVNDTTLTKNISSFSFDEKEFRLYSTGSENGGAVRDYDRLDLFASLFKQPGTYTITLTAPDYADVSYELTVSGSTEPTEPTDPKPEPEKPNPDEGTVTIPTTAPTVTSTGSYSSKYILDFSDFKAWVGKIKSIKINGTTLKSVDSSDNVSSDKYYLDAENGCIYMYLSIYSDQKIVISADGCDKLILTASSGSGWSDPPVISYTGTAPGGIADAPTVANIEENPSTMVTAAFCRVSFTDDVAEYLSNVTKVTLNGEKLQSGGIYDSSTKTFKVGTVSATGVKAYLDFSMDCFAEGTSTIVVTADDYKDLTFVVTNTDGVLSIR